MSLFKTTLGVSVLALVMIVSSLVITQLSTPHLASANTADGCPGNTQQGDGTNGDISKCYAVVSTSGSGGPTQWVLEPGTPTNPNSLADTSTDVTACPPPSQPGGNGNPLPGATDPRTCYILSDPLSPAQGVAHLTQAAADAITQQKTAAAASAASAQAAAGCADSDKDANGNCKNSDDAVLNCGGSVLDWIICPAITAAQGAAEQVDQFITNLLDVDASKIFDTSVAGGGQGYYKAWSSFRIIATAILIIGALVMVTSSALGFEILDAYTIRKVLPRLLIAVIGISLSWPIMEFVVRFFDTVGFDIRSLIYAPFKGLGGSINPAVGLGSYLAVAGTALALGFASLTFILTALLAMFVGFIILVIRQLAIIVIIIVAPVAIACYILPNTQKIWKLWMDNFLGLMLMFPIISAFIAAGHVFAAVSLADSAQTTGITQIIGIAAYFIPYFLLPIAFRLATGVIGTIAGVVNDRGRGAFDRLKKTRQNAMAERGARVNRYATQQRATASRALQARSNTSNSWLGKKALRYAAGSVGGYNIEAKSSVMQAGTNKEIEDQIATGRDDAIRGLTVNKKAIKRMGDAAAIKDGLLKIDEKTGARSYKSLGGAFIDEASVDEGHARWGGNHYAQQAALAYEGRKAMDEGQTEDVSDRFTSLARDQWGMSEREGKGAWLGAGFQNQNKNLAWKNTSIDFNNADKETGRGGATLDGGRLLKEAYYKKGSYQLSQMDSAAIQAMDTAHYQAKQTLASNTATVEQRQQAQLQVDYARGVAETFMRDMNGGGQMGEQDGVPINATASGASGRRQAGGNGAAAVNEKARQFAINTGVYKDAPSNPPVAGPPDRSQPGSPQT